MEETGANERALVDEFRQYLDEPLIRAIIGDYDVDDEEGFKSARQGLLVISENASFFQADDADAAAIFAAGGAQAEAELRLGSEPGNSPSSGLAILENDDQDDDQSGQAASIGEDEDELDEARSGTTRTSVVSSTNASASASASASSPGRGRRTGENPRVTKKEDRGAETASSTTLPQVVTVLDPLSDEAKDAELRAMFPNMKAFDIASALRRGKGSFDKAMDELLTLQMLESTGQRPKGIDAFFKLEAGDEDDEGEIELEGDGYGIARMDEMTVRYRRKGGARGGTGPVFHTTGKTTDRGDSDSDGYSPATNQPDASSPPPSVWGLAPGPTGSIRNGPNASRAQRLHVNYSVRGEIPVSGTESGWASPADRTPSTRPSAPATRVRAATSGAAATASYATAAGALGANATRAAHSSPAQTRSVIDHKATRPHSAGGGWQVVGAAPSTANSSSSSSSSLPGTSTPAAASGARSVVEASADRRAHYLSQAASLSRRGGGASKALYRAAGAVAHVQAAEAGADLHAGLGRLADESVARQKQEQQQQQRRRRQAGGADDVVVVDLHGMTLHDGVRIALREAAAWWEALGENERQRRATAAASSSSSAGRSLAAGRLTLVTGAGRHSVDGRARMHAFVSKALVQAGWRVEMATGSVVLTGKRGW